MQQLVFKKMWELIKSGITNDKKVALKAAWVIVKIKQGYTVSFNFVKADGTQRSAVSSGYIPAFAIPKTDRPRPINIVTYFDQEKSAWRSFDVRRLAV